MKLANLITACLFIAMITSCSGGSKNNTTNDVSAVDSITPSGILALYEYEDSGSHTSGSTTFKYRFQFKNDKQLAVVTNPMDYQYYDNKVILDLKKNGQTLLNRPFTKADFKTMIPDNIYSKYALVGFCYNIDKENASDAIYFIATIGDPDTSADSSYAFEVRISPSGDVSYSVLQDPETLPIKNGMTIDPENDETL